MSIIWTSSNIHIWTMCIVTWLSQWNTICSGVYIYIYIYIYIYVCVCVCVCVCVYVYVYVYMYMCVCMCMYMYTCICVCVLCVCVRAHTYTAGIFKQIESWRLFKLYNHLQVPTSIANWVNYILEQRREVPNISLGNDRCLLQNYNNITLCGIMQSFLLLCYVV